MLEPPKSYTEMLPKLHRTTFFSTLIFFIFLVVFEYIPLIGLPEKYIPPIKDHAEAIKWGLSFGVLPIIIAIIMYIISGALDLHNNVAKFLGIRYLWEKYLIIRPLKNTANITRELDNDEHQKVMSKFYYPAVREIEDKHYIELFWNKVYYFWIMFEYTIIACFTCLSLTIFKSLNTFPVKGSLFYLWIWVFFCFLFTFLVFMVSVRQRTESQVRQIPKDKIIDFFIKNNIN